MRAIVIVLGAAALLAAVACSKPSADNTQPGPATAKLDSVQAKDVFNSRCATCHGPNGDGNGPAAAALNPKPRNYHDKDWQKKVTDDDLKKTITYGGAAVGKSPIMPASPDLDGKPEVLDGLVAIVREFGKN
jgi:mono/diheme cytochrome c family protein